MASSYEFRRYSANCLAFAENVSNPDDKARLIEMAQEFFELAIRQEQRDLQSTTIDAGESHESLASVSLPKRQVQNRT